MVKGNLLGIDIEKEIGIKSKRRNRTLTPADKKRIAAKQGWKCKMCDKLLSVRYHIDHIKELSEGGSDKESNLQALCSNCHDDKTEEDRNRKKQRKLKDKKPVSLLEGIPD